MSEFSWGRLAIDNYSGQERGAARSAAAKKWMQRFRKRWNLTLGRLPTKDILPAATMQAKVRFVITKNIKHLTP